MSNTLNLSGVSSWRRAQRKLLPEEAVLYLQPIKSRCLLMYLSFFFPPKRRACLRFPLIFLNISKNCVLGANLEPKCDWTTRQFVQIKQANQNYQGEPCAGGNVPGHCFLFAGARWQKPARAVHVSSFWRENNCGDCSIQTDLSSSSPASSRLLQLFFSSIFFLLWDFFRGSYQQKKKNHLLDLS